MAKWVWCCTKDNECDNTSEQVATKQTESLKKKSVIVEPKTINKDLNRVDAQEQLY